MKIRSALARGALKLGKHIGDVSKEAYNRLKWFDYYEVVGKNARKTCRHFGISPDTFYRWKKRYRPDNLKTLEERSRRPRRVRRPTWTTETAQAVLTLREEYPPLGKRETGCSLKGKGYQGIGLYGRKNTQISQRQGCAEGADKPTTFRLGRGRKIVLTQ